MRVGPTLQHENTSRQELPIRFARLGQSLSRLRGGSKAGRLRPSKLDTFCLDDGIGPVWYSEAKRLRPGVLLPVLPSAAAEQAAAEAADDFVTKVAPTLYIEDATRGSQMHLYNQKWSATMPVVLNARHLAQNQGRPKKIVSIIES